MSEKNYDMENATVIPREIAESTDLDKVLEWLEANNKNGSFAVEQGTTVINLGGERPDDNDDWQEPFGKIKALFIPDSVTKIGSYAFCFCGFKNIDIPDSVTEIGNYAFWSCERLEEITVPISVKKIGGGVFEDCCSLKTANLPFYDESAIFWGCNDVDVYTWYEGDYMVYNP